MKYLKLFSIAAVSFCLYWTTIWYVSNNFLDIYIEYYDLFWLMIIWSVIISIIKFLVLEAKYRISQKNQLVIFFYQALVSKWFPNPRNYHIDRNYLLDVANTEWIDSATRVQAMRLWSEINILSESWKILQANRLKFALIIAINKYFVHFKDEYQTTPDIQSSYDTAEKYVDQSSYLATLILY